MFPSNDDDRTTTTATTSTTNDFPFTQPVSPFTVAAAEAEDFRCRGDLAVATASDDDGDDGDGGTTFRPRGGQRRGRRAASRLGASSRRFSDVHEREEDAAAALSDDEEDEDEEEERHRAAARATALALTPSKVSGLRGLVAICGGAAAAGIAADGTPVVAPSDLRRKKTRTKKATTTARTNETGAGREILAPPSRARPPSKVTAASEATAIVVHATAAAPHSNGDADKNNADANDPPNTNDPPSSSSTCSCPPSSVAPAATVAAFRKSSCSLDRARSSLAANGALLEIVGTAHVRGAVRTLAKSVVRGLRAWQNPTVAPAGLGGTYFFNDEEGHPAAIIKPCDEEPLAPNNPKGFVGRKLGDPGLKPTVRVGEAALREVAAYLLDHDGAARVPPTVLVRVAHPVFHVAAAAPAATAPGSGGPPSSSRYAPSLPPVPDDGDGERPRPVSPDTAAALASSGALVDGEKTPCKRNGRTGCSSSHRPASSTLSAALRRSGGGAGGVGTAASGVVAGGGGGDAPRSSSSCCSPKTGGGNCGTHPSSSAAAAAPQATVPRPPPKLASMQAFVRHDGDASEVGASRFSVRDVHRIGILDVRLFNTDRHAGNMLFVRDETATVQEGRREGDGDGGDPSRSAALRRAAAALCGLGPAPLTLYPIDHGFCLPEALEPPYFEWMFWPQAARPFSREELASIAAIDVDADVALLRAQLPSLHLGCLRVLAVGSTVLKMCAAAGLTLAEVGAALSRPLVGMAEEASEVEKLCWEARRVALLAQEREPEASGVGSSDEEEDEEDSAHEEGLGGRGGGETPVKRRAPSWAAAPSALAPRSSSFSTMSRSATCPLPLPSKDAAAVASGSGGLQQRRANDGNAGTDDDEGEEDAAAAAAAFAFSSVAGAVAGGWAAAELAQPRTDAEDLLMLDQQQGGRRGREGASPLATSALLTSSNSPLRSPETPLVPLLSAASSEASLSTSFTSLASHPSSCSADALAVVGGGDGGGGAPSAAQQGRRRVRRQQQRSGAPPSSSSFPSRQSVAHRRASYGGALGGSSRGVATTAACCTSVASAVVDGAAAVPSAVSATAAARKTATLLLPPRLSLDSRAAAEAATLVEASSPVAAAASEGGAAVERSPAVSTPSRRPSPSRSTPVPERRRGVVGRGRVALPLQTEEGERSREDDGSDDSDSSSGSGSLPLSHPLSGLERASKASKKKRGDEKRGADDGTRATAAKTPAKTTNTRTTTMATKAAAAYPPPVVPGSAPGAALPLADLDERGWRAFLEELERLLSGVLASGKWRGGQRGVGGVGVVGDKGGVDDMLGASCPRF